MPVELYFSEIFIVTPLTTTKDNIWLELLIIEAVVIMQAWRLKRWKYHDFKGPHNHIKHSNFDQVDHPLLIRPIMIYFHALIMLIHPLSINLSDMDN